MTVIAENAFTRIALKNAKYDGKEVLSFSGLACIEQQIKMPEDKDLVIYLHLIIDIRLMHSHGLLSSWNCFKCLIYFMPCKFKFFDRSSRKKSAKSFSFSKSVNLFANKKIHEVTLKEKSV